MIGGTNVSLSLRMSAGIYLYFSQSSMYVCSSVRALPVHSFIHLPPLDMDIFTELSFQDVDISLLKNNKYSGILFFFNRANGQASGTIGVGRRCGKTYIHRSKAKLFWIPNPFRDAFRLR